MRKYKYEVIYLNGNEKSFPGDGFTEAIIRAMNFAYEQGWDVRIKYISNEQGEVISDIGFPPYKYSYIPAL